MEKITGKCDKTEMIKTIFRITVVNKSYELKCIGTPRTNNNDVHN